MRGGDLSIEEAAVELGMSPTAVIRLLESGQLPSHLGPDGRRRRVSRQDLDAHREERFAIRQQLVQEQRARRWAEASGEVAAELDPAAATLSEPVVAPPYQPRHAAPVQGAPSEAR